MNFDKAFEHVVGLEGGYSDHPLDRGGPTKYGITQRVARAHGYTGDMRNLPLSKAKEIYKKDYWDINRLDDVCSVSYDLALELFDTGVNMGVSIAGKYLQRSLNALNVTKSGGRMFAPLVVDGRIGPASVSALKSVSLHRGATGVKAVLKLCDCLQGVRYIEITENSESQKAFMLGWVSNRLR